MTIGRGKRWQREGDSQHSLPKKCDAVNGAFLIQEKSSGVAIIIIIKSSTVCKIFSPGW